MIDSETIRRIMDATDIVDVVREFVTLKKSGVNYKGLCPFHNEKTPSFTVSPSKQFCKCFSCGKGGNAVHFLMELEHMTYPEAIKWLGRKYGIEVKEKELTDEERILQSERESMFALNEWANNYFQNILHNDVSGVAIGMAYFRNRGFRDDIIQKFSLGFSLEQRDALAISAKKHGFNEEFLLKTGLCFKTDNGDIMDRYHGRVIFPVHSVSGRVVAFGGRILNTEKVQNVGKYVNSPESIIYSKSHELYGLYQAKNAIVRLNRCFLVEGYTDVISMHQSGIENVVASSGTSLTEGQIRLLHRFTENITVLYDGDAAGIKASLRGIDMLLEEGLNIKVLLLPDGDDPDSFARKYRAEDFQKYIDEHQVDFIRFKTNLLLKEAEGDPIKKADLINNVVKSVSVIPNNVVRQMYIHETSVNLSVSEDLIVNEINKIHRQAQDKNKSSEKSSELENNTDNLVLTQGYSLSKLNQQNIEYKEETLLISTIIRYGEIPIRRRQPTEIEQNDNKAYPQDAISVVQFIAKDLATDGLSFRTPLFEQILTDAVNQITTNEKWVSLPYFLQHPNIEISKFASQVGEDDFVLSKGQREQYIEEKYRLDEIVPRLLHDFKYSLIKERIKNLLAQLRSPNISEKPDKARALMQEFMELSELERQFAHVLGERVILK